MLRWPDKYPEEVLDYSVQWANRLDGDVITGFVAIVRDGNVQIESVDYRPTLSTVWLTGGESGTSSRISCIITTAAGRTMEELAAIRIT